jgi:DNA-binding response OmpR family regulator
VPTVLIVEDDPGIRTVLGRALTERGYAVHSAANGMSGLQMALDVRPELVVLDLGLPDVDGTEVLRMLRAVSTVPVVVATARDDEAAVIAALRTGADDYVVKPFSVEHLDARINAVLRRSGSGAEVEPPLRVGELMIDPGAREARLGERPLDLTPREFDLLTYLARRPGQVVTKRDLLAEVWRLPYGGSDKTVDVHVSWLRRKLGESAQEPVYLHTVRGVGVKIAGP